MDWSTRKKTGCFAIMGAVILAIAAYVVYENFIKVTPTCFDGIQNQNERGIDCGGICARVCPMDARTIVPLWSRVFPVTKGVYSLVAYVENQNVTAGVRKVSYEFRVYDDQNILAAEPVTGTTFIGPNERTAIFESPVQTGNRVPKNVFFSFTSAPDWTTTDARFQTPGLRGANTELTDVTTAPKLSADIVNDSLYDYRNVTVVAILYGADGNAINASQTVLSAVPQQSTEKVYFTWPQKFDQDVTKIEIIPRIDPFGQGG